MLVEDIRAVAIAQQGSVNEHAGLEVAQVVPVNRIPKTTSGKVQRQGVEKWLTTESSR